MNEIQHYLHLRFEGFEEEPLNCMVKLFDFEIWLALLTGSDELRKFGFKKVKKVQLNIIVYTTLLQQKKKSLDIKHWPLFRERVSKLRKNPLADTFTILCRQAEDIKEMITLLEISQSKYGSL